MGGLDWMTSESFLSTIMSSWYETKEKVSQAIDQIFYVSFSFSLSHSLVSPLPPCLSVFSTSSPYFLPLFICSILSSPLFSGRKEITQQISLILVVVWWWTFWKLKEVTGMAVSRCWKGFKSYCSLSVSGKEQHPGSQLRLLLRPVMGMALFRRVHIDRKQLIYFVSLHMWKPPNCFDCTSTGRRLWREKKQINPLSLGESWDNFKRSALKQNKFFKGKEKFWHELIKFMCRM